MKVTARFYSAMGCVLALVASVAAGQDAVEVMGCGSLQNAYGPYDYRTQKQKLKIVEKHHFGVTQENLTKKVGLASNIDYTLRASPNHHRALIAMIKLGLREKKSTLYGAAYSIECYMRRAEAFQPDDAMVKVIYGIYHLRHGQGKQAVEKLEAARALESQNANVHYNLGLAYIELGKYDEALASAQRAYALGFPLPGLRDKLQRAGKWKEPPAGAGARRQAQTGKGKAVAPLDGDGTNLAPQEPEQAADSAVATSE